MSRSVHQVADVLNRNQDNLHKYTCNNWQERTLHAIRKCRTAALGGHIDKCNNPECDHIHISYNSCRNRHCPKCQGHKREQWVRAREKELLDVPYFHVVFTLPDALNSLCLSKPKKMYDMLFKCSWSVIKDFAANPGFLGAKTGMTAILHTWGQNLALHPHLHCVVPGGGITLSNKWKKVKSGGKYLFPVDELSKVFRARFVEQLRQRFCLPQTFYDKLFDKDWVVYCKKPFAGPRQVINYQGRYTHKTAIANSRIIGLSNDTVSFMAKDYRNEGRKYMVTLSDKEFIRRFALHILPKGFVRIRHYGILSSTCKKEKLKHLQELLGIPELTPHAEPVMLNLCPKCKKGELVTLLTFDERGPPEHLVDQLQESQKSGILKLLSI